MRSFFLVVLSVFASGYSLFSQANDRVDNQQLKLRIKARTPQQMAAFYEARGFPHAMIKKLNNVCFFTVGIKNKTRTILWHDLGKWKFTSAGQTINRLDHSYWKAKWLTMKIPMASQSTFRWTLLPEQLDFHPQESEGGNITLPRGPLNYEIEAIFKTGADQSGQLLKVKLTDVRCAEDTGGS